MKKIIIALMMLGLATAGYADVNVRGYTKKDGTYVAPHKRSNPNRSTQDNWSHKRSEVCFYRK